MANTCKSNHINVLDFAGVVRMRVREEEGSRLLRAGLVIARGKKVIACLQISPGVSVTMCRQTLRDSARVGVRDRLPVAEDNTTTYVDGRTVLHRWMFHDHPWGGLW
jgi:hypothetical protein